MSAGHKHGDERAASKLADDYYDRGSALVAACTVDGSYDVPWLANRSRDLKVVYRDRRVPRILECGIDTDLSLPWHELPEGAAMDDGLPYDEGSPNAHCDVATPLERREVERQKPDDPDIWAKYTAEMDGYIREVDDESIARVPLDMDLRVFAEDDRKLLEQIIAAQDAEKSAPRRGRAAGRQEISSMPQILKPLDVAKRLKAGEKREDIFLDANGAVKAKLIGPRASMRAVDEDSRTIDFVISTEAIDRYDSTIKLGGWKLANYRRNPVVLWGHDDYTPPIGRGGVRTEGNALCSTVEFAPPDIYPLAETIYQLTKARFINSASVGFMPIDYEYSNDDSRPYGVDFTEQELLEWSIVSIPANPECLVQARSAGIDCSPLIGWAERALDRGGFLVIPLAELEALRRGAGAPTLLGFRGGKIDWNKLKLLPEQRAAGEAAPALAATDDGLRAALRPVAVALNAGMDIDVGVLAILGVLDKQGRGGRVLSEANEQTLCLAHDHAQTAIDHCNAAMTHLRSVIEQNHADDDDDKDKDKPDGDGDATQDDPEQAAAAAAAAREADLQRQRVTVLKVKGAA
jgi:HK97 family phage prohead protease